MLTRVRQSLRRKFELFDFYTEQQQVVMQFKLQRFIDFKAYKLKFIIGGKNVPFTKKKRANALYDVRIPIDALNTNSNRIDVYYNGKKLWVTMDHEVKDIHEWSDAIYIMHVDQSIYVNQYKTDYPLAKTVQLVTVEQRGDSALLQSNSGQIFDALVVMNRSRQVEVPIVHQRVAMEDIQPFLTKQSYVIYGVSDQMLYPLIMQSPSTTQYLMLNYYWMGQRLTVQPQHIEVSYVNVTTMVNETSLHLNTEVEVSETEADQRLVHLALVNSDMSVIQTLPTTVTGAFIHSQLDVETLEDLTNKKLVAVFENPSTETNIYVMLKSRQRINFKACMRVQDEIYELTVKKSPSVTFVAKKPKVKMGVNAVSPEQLNIFYQPHSIYDRYQSYFTFEERASQQRYEIPITRGEQDITIPYNELETLKSSPKNIIDIFITIYDGETIIRKDKIKFKLGDYKKDNYLTYKALEREGKRAYYMLTLTPFKNIKFESFELTDAQYHTLTTGVKDPNVWLIGERTDTAQDNGIQLFYWLKQHTDIEAYYVIDAEAKDYAHIKHLEGVVPFGSASHFEVAARAKVLVSTHDLENILPYKTARGFFGYEDCVRIFLQHGVMGRKYVEYDKANYDLPFHLVHVSSQAEKDDVVIDRLGYASEDVAVTGLPRFDRLPLEPADDITKILIMPTWRDWLNSDYAFSHSDYLNNYLSLLNDPDLAALSEKYHVEINFYPHYRAQAFFKEYLAESESLVNYVELGEQTVQSLLIDHDILITDYSSVSFDFSYMHKPVLFYHFDVERFFRKGILRPVEETFIGKIAYNQKGLINQIESVLKQQKAREDQPLDLIFDQVDHHNCERVYEAICYKLKQL
ncbi:CDP-glycerol glycerophosphotransferase [Staphylococcus auricularis]|uniref:CDP-glycerol glycerophosphotransferase family protein n=2 Tax=Staphylococcus auricularis TaxID=29379 RepID=A0AAW7MC98_9STAP|nr:CDP-glycerol glycerophosphotransferase family protein [Staphylococcus auricularis]MCG7340822.1 CDP-glycerol glycerophosphotransferase family protein [Staphylococcus auricularis]MDC6327321.1 CDP-glycerol glycerophosphotransferase family protein [Staphylococcus auricularis]MDN4532965.1 CDP-glycerol glycerophosphotransferase family protein [Staphylococcus auricularis]SQJ06541.1 galactosamine-containing minor teichoic acid biosynthesis protein [Staphylococcus auricularis]BCU51439.1 CDP-glycerol